MKLAFRRPVLSAALFSLASAGVYAASMPAEVTIHDEKPFPESLTSTNDGTLIIGSLAKGMIFRATPGAATAEPWIQPGTAGLQRILGVLADERSNTLWVCSSRRPPQGQPTALKSFDLKSAASKGSFDFPSENSLCNDIAVARDGTVYATDTTNARVMRLKKGATALDVWVKDDKLASADGIAFGDNSTLYVNTFSSGHLVRVPVNKDGAAGTVVQLQTSQLLTRPDGMRPIGKNEFLMIEGAGKLDRVTVSGDMAKIEVLKDGFTGPTAVTPVHHTAWVIEGKLNYMNDPKLKETDPGPFKIYPAPFGKSGGD